MKRRKKLLLLAVELVAILLVMNLVNMNFVYASSNNAQFISQSVPTTMVAGQQYNVWVKMRNTGSTTWTQATNYRLGSQNPRDNANWGFNRVYLSASDSVGPGQYKTFYFTVTAPSTPGNWNFQWRMLREGVEWFGGYTTNVVVNVTASDNSTGNITVDLNTACYPFAGVGWNVHAAMFRYGDWNTIKSKLDQSGMHFARVIVHMEWWRPSQNSYTWNSAEMQSIYNFLQYCKDNNIKVCVHNWGCGGRWDNTSAWPNHYWWLANCCHKDPDNSQNKWAKANGGPETDHPYNADQFGQSIYHLVNHLYTTKGYTCVKYIGIWNEPGGAWGYDPRDMDGNGNPDYSYPNDFYNLYDKVFWYLHANDLDDDVKQVGSDRSATSPNDPMNDIGNTLSAWSGQRVDNYLGAMSYHSYVENYSSLAHSVKMQIYNNDYDSNYEDILALEIGDDPASTHSSAAEKIANSLDCAKKVIGYAKQGTYAIARWAYNNCGGGWDATTNYGQTIVAQNFNPMRLYCAYLPRQSTDYGIMKTTVTKSAGYFDAVDVQFWASGAIRDVVWVVNEDSKNRDVTVKFDNLSTTKTFKKYYIDLDNTSCPITYGGTFTVNASDNDFTDTIPKKSLVIYREQY